MDRLPPSGSASAPVRRSPRTSTTSLVSNGTASSTTRPRPISPSPAPSSVILTASNSRTRLRTSNGDLSAHQPTADRASTKGSRDSLRSRVEKIVEPAKSSAPKNELLDTLQAELKHIRDLITCKICYSLLYEPYTTSCGHTFCYNCFCKTFEVHKPKKCPECRTPLRTAPAPAYTLREITRKIIKKNELLPDGETVQVHSAMVEEHEQLVKKDRDGPQGLFKGLWRPKHASCPMCGDGLQNNVCSTCGTVFNMADELEDPDLEGNFTDLTTSEENDQDFDMRDYLDDFDEDLDLQYDYHHDWVDNEGYYDHEGSDYSSSGYPTMISRYLSEGSDFGEPHDYLGQWAREPPGHPDFRGMVSPRRSQRRSYAASSVSSYPVNTVIEEEEEEDDDGGSSAQDGASSVGDFASVDANTTGTNSQRSGSSNFSRNSATSQNGLSTASSTYTSARSTPIPIQTPVSSISSTSRRRRRESNTPTSSVGQPRQRRRMGSVIDLTQTSTRASPSTATRQSYVQPRSQRASSAHDNSSLSSDDISEEASHHTYVSLEDDMEDDSDGAETTVGWEPNPSSNPRSRNTGSLTPTADRPQPSGFQLRLNNQQRAQDHRLTRMPSVIRSLPISALDENDADDETSSNRGVRSRRSRILRQPSIASNQIDSPIEESDSTDTPTDTPERSQRNGSRQRSLDPNIRSRLLQSYLDIRNDSQTPQMHIDQLRDMNRTPGFSFSRPGTSNRHRSTTPSAVQAMNTASPHRNRMEMARINGERDFTPSEQLRRPNVGPSAVSASEMNPTTQNREAEDSNVLRTQSQTGVPSPLRSRVQTGQNHFSRPIEAPEQAENRLGPRPPSVIGRRVTTPGATRNNLSSPVHILAATGGTNPFMRHRSSRRQLNVPASTANVRNVPSFSGLRNQAARNNPVPAPHRPPSRTQSRNQQRSLNHTPSMMHLPQSQPSPFNSYSGPNEVENHALNEFNQQMRLMAQYEQTNYSSLRRNNANPFLQQSSTGYQSSWANTQHTAGLSNAGQYTSAAAPRGLATRRSRSSLGGQAPPPGVIFNTNAGINSGAASSVVSSAAHTGGAAGVGANAPNNNSAATQRTLGQRRSSRNMALPLAGAFVPTSGLHAGVMAGQPGRLGLRTPVNGAGVRAAGGVGAAAAGQSRA